MVSCISQPILNIPLYKCMAVSAFPLDFCSYPGRSSSLPRDMMAPLPPLRDLDRPVVFRRRHVAPDSYYFPSNLGLNNVWARDRVSEALKVRAWGYVRVYLESGDHSSSVRGSIRRHFVAMIIKVISKSQDSTDGGNFVCGGDIRDLCKNSRIRFQGSGKLGYLPSLFCVYRRI